MRFFIGGGYGGRAHGRSCTLPGVDSARIRRGDAVSDGPAGGGARRSPELAALGALVWRVRSKDRDWAVVVLLFLGAFTTIIGGNYGGEGVLRVYFFSLPGAVCLIAALISKLPEFWHGQLALSCLLLLLTPLFFFARWGNELYEMVRPDCVSCAPENWWKVARSARRSCLALSVAARQANRSDFSDVSLLRYFILAYPGQARNYRPFALVT